MQLISRIHNYVVGFIIFACLSTGCGISPESSFELSDDSKLPIWFERYLTTQNGPLTVQLDIYIRSSGRQAKLTLLDKDQEVLEQVEGTLIGSEPITLHNSRPRTLSFI